MRDMRRGLSRMLCATILSLSVSSAANAQDNVLDLRLLEINSDRKITYQNFIYARSLASGKFLLQATYLRLPQIDYNEFAAATAIRATTLGDVSVYLMAGIGVATDDTYAEPALLLQDVAGRLTGALYVQRYIPLGESGVGQWLLDSFELQYAVHIPFTLGAALYAYRPDGGSWLTKIGPKIGVTDRFGSTELRVTTVSGGGGNQFQLRRIIVF